MSLYNHVENKEDLLDGILELFVGEIARPPAGAEWRSAMRERAVSARQAFSRHPWAAALMDSRVSSGPARLRYFDAMVGTLMGAGFPLEQVGRALSVLDCYIYGFAIQRNNMASGEHEQTETRAGALQDSAPVETYPHLARMIEWAMRNGYDEEADFEFGLALILEGLEGILRAGSGRVPSSPRDARRMTSRTRNRPPNRRPRPRPCYLSPPEAFAVERGHGFRGSSRPSRPVRRKPGPRGPGRHAWEAGFLAPSGRAGRSIRPRRRRPLPARGEQGGGHVDNILPPQLHEAEGRKYRAYRNETKYSRLFSACPNTGRMIDPVFQASHPANTRPRGTAETICQGLIWINPKRRAVPTTAFPAVRGPLEPLQEVAPEQELLEQGWNQDDLDERQDSRSGPAWFPVGMRRKRRHGLPFGHDVVHLAHEQDQPHHDQRKAR
ncbi:MAG: TetR/AcrR family transcriptional regulator C-terminal domain-containing protein [Candidatus Moduliflexus flocculans]|nr:TetR/AcrR family transcriptional regulator C-terminal domain-containing protein [Candidatus Moduliflexus flocculans]